MPIDFGTTDAEFKRITMNFLSRVDSDLYNGGKDGLITQFNKWVTEHDAREEERTHQHEQNQTRLNIIIALLIMISGYILIAVTWHPWDHSQIKAPLTQNPQPQLSQDAITPPY